MGSGGEGAIVESVGKNNSLQVSCDQNSPANADEAAQDVPEFDQEKTVLLKRALRVGGEMQIYGDSQKQRLNNNFVQLDPRAREYTPVYSLQTSLIVPPPAPFAPCNFVQPTLGHPSQVVYGAPASQFSTGMPLNMYSTVPQHFNLNCMPSIVPPPPVAWDPSITIQLLNTVPLVTPPIQQSSTYYASSAVPSACAQLSVIGRKQISRALSLTMVPTEISDAVLRRDLSAWGPIREMELVNRRQGLVTVHYYDLRHAKAALTDIQEQHLMQQVKLRDYYQFPHEGLSTGTPISPKGLIGGSVVWAQYTTPFTYQADSLNQGTLVVFNLDANISMETLRSVFDSYGAVKEVRETPWKGHHKFVEFFDVRDAARALKEMDGQDIGGRRVKIEFSRPGGQSRMRSRIQAAALIPNTASLQNTDYPHQRRWNSDKEVCTQPASASLYIHPTNTKEESNTQSHMGIGPGRVGLGVVRGESGLGRRRGGNGSDIRSDHCTKSSMANGYRSSAAAAAEWRAHNGKNGCQFIPQFAFDEVEAVSNCNKARTTVMIKNIPNKYNQQMLLSVLDQHCASCNDPRNNPDGLVSAYDFVYLPIDFQNRCNLGYAFVNFTSPKATLKLYRDFHNQRWEAFNSRKVCEVTYARVQGRIALEDHFRNSRFACDTNEFLPLAFDPPRNGNNLTDRIVIGGLDHSRSEAGVHVCSNSIQQADGNVGAADAKPMMSNLNGTSAQPPRQLNGQSYNRRMATSGTYYNRSWNNRHRSNTAHYRPLNAGATTSSV